ncbi:MAG: 5-(carboxyamino)imidazole ribonucleotide mutase [Bifidobacteriaceae bacterium]|jgi:5-(carboxyamino)imidazole ribonucleotide mutase|nr:5-(carboxyamino)imidazole ribonucleotide mutase [Bifidobacteriaceae bacterium]
MKIQPRVGIVMGSDSDWKIMNQSAASLDELGVSYEVRVISAHRLPDETIQYGRQAAGRGLAVIIAGAGGAAALPGMLAAVTELPVIGVPVALAQLDGLDSLLSIAQMPRGVPVATVAVNGAFNAGLLAGRIIAAGQGRQSDAVRAALADFRASQAAAVAAKETRLLEQI